MWGIRQREQFLWHRNSGFILKCPCLCYCLYLCKHLKLKNNPEPYENILNCFIWGETKVDLIRIFILIYWLSLLFLPDFCYLLYLLETWIYNVIFFWATFIFHWSIYFFLLVPPCFYRQISELFGEKEHIYSIFLFPQENAVFVGACEFHHSVNFCRVFLHTVASCSGEEYVHRCWLWHCVTFGILE